MNEKTRTNTGSADPLLSLVIVGRNDNYMGNYTWRITTALNYLVRNIARLGRAGDVEIILTDWNSPVPFHKELPLPPEAREILKFLVVPPEVAVPVQKDSNLPNPIAQNAAIRRARGRFVATTDADIMFTEGVLRNLFALLDGQLQPPSPVDRTFWVAARRQVPVNRTQHNPPLPEISGYIERNLTLLKRDRLFEGLGAPSGLVMMAREIWNEMRGFDERLIYWGWTDIDLHLRATQKYPWFDLGNMGIEVVHLEHYSGGAQRQDGPNRKTNGFSVSRRLDANDENWGLRSADLALASPEAVFDRAHAARVAQAAAQARAAAIPGQALVQEWQAPEIVDVVRKATPVLMEPMDPTLLCAIAWYAARRHPRTLLELGVQRSIIPALVLTACPTCECFLVDQWSEDESGGQPPIHNASNLAGTAAPQAQTQFLTGDPATALDRLFGTVAPGLELDLVAFRTEPRFGNPLENARAVGQRLAPGGAILTWSRSQAEHMAVWKLLAEQFPQAVTLQIQNQAGEVNAGFLLNVTAG